jgi:hypothetical protein
MDRKGFGRPWSTKSASVMLRRSGAGLNFPGMAERGLGLVLVDAEYTDDH